MKKEYLPWILLYLGFAIFFGLAFRAPANFSAGAKFAIVGITWCRIVSFIVVGIVMEMSWYQPRTQIFNATRLLTEFMIMYGLWQIARPAEALASLIAIAMYEISRQQFKYS